MVGVEDGRKWLHVGSFLVANIIRSSKKDQRLKGRRRNGTTRKAKVERRTIMKLNHQRTATQFTKTTAIVTLTVRVERKRKTMAAQKRGKQSSKGKGKGSYQKVQDEPQSQHVTPERKSKKKRSNRRSYDDELLREMIVGPNGQREIVEMEADGNCLFRSISHQLNRDYGERHDEVRSEICDFLDANEEEFSIFLLLDDDEEDVREFNSYVAEMREHGTWGGDVEIVCAARYYKRNVTIFSASGAYNISCGCKGDEATSGPDFLLSYHENSHYNSVHDEDISNSLHEESRRSLDEEKGFTEDESVEDSPPSPKKKLPKPTPKRNAMCPCGSKLRYKKCCLELDKSKIRSEKFKQMQGLEIESDTDDDNNETKTREVEGGFNILTI